MAKEITFADNLPNIIENDVTNETFARAIRKLQPISRNKIKDRTLQKQRSVICILKDEQREILNDLKVIKSPYNDKINNKTVQEISKLVHDEEKIEKHIETEKEYIQDLNSQIEKTQYLLLWERKRRGKVHHGKSGTRENVVNGLENRLHMSRVKLSETLKENQQYRKEIDLYLKTRSNFNTLYNRLIHKLSVGKNTIQDILQQSEHVYNEREKLIKRLSKLKEKGKLSFNTQRAEMFELMLCKPKEKAHFDFLSTKNTDRSSMLQQRKASYTIEAERLQTAEKVSLYQNILEQINNYAEECGATDGAAEFYIKEEANLYQLLLYANELNDELTVLQNDLDDKMKEYLEKKDQLAEEQFKKTSKIGQMNAHLTEIKIFKEKQEKQVEDHTEQLDKLFKGIQNLFAIGNCDNSPVMLLLGDNKEDITVYNFKLYLEIIEQKIVEFMNIDDLHLFEMPKPSLGLAHHTDHLKSGSMIKHQSLVLPTKIFISKPCVFCEEPKSHMHFGEKSKTVHIQ